MEDALEVVQEGRVAVSFGQLHDGQALTVVDVERGEGERARFEQRPEEQTEPEAGGEVQQRGELLVACSPSLLR